MTQFANDQWVMLLLVFVLGMFVGMFLFSGRKWKRRYREQDALHREELRRRDAAESDRRLADGDAIAARDDRIVPGDTVRPVGRRRWFGR